MRVDRDDRHACVGVHFGRGHDDRAIDERATESGQVSPLPAGTPALAGPCIGQQLVVGVPEPRAGTLEDLGAEGLELGDQDPDHVRAPGPQTSRDQARLVAKFLDDPQHPRRGGGRDAVAAVDYLGDGCDGHARRLGDVRDRQSACHGGHVTV